MTEDEKKADIVVAALKAGFKRIKDRTDATYALNEAEVLQAASHMLAVTEADLHRFVRGVRRHTVEQTVAEMSHMLLTIQGAAKSYMQRNNDLLAKNVELEQRARDANARADTAEAWLEPIERRVLQLIGPDCKIGAQVELLVECDGDGNEHEHATPVGATGEIFSLECYEHAQGLQVGISIPVGADGSIEVYFDEEDSEPLFPFKILGARS